ncbi:MAG: tRNA 2-thiouridine(34) synthase MnmA, partial [Deltaproteobacteria bacterium]|nr:tRNA 2-thiouridine(34) synthase MnmA [Deltaproteobacteria bacterium]
FRNEYLAGRTPNPCVVCNREVKFGFLLEKARKSGIEFDFFATGRYAIIERSGGRYSLKRAKDHSKDQSYFLYTLTPNQLSTTLFPLGTYKKPQVREIARSLGLQTSERPESQDFVTNGNYGILFNKDEATEGDIVDEKGNVLGKHRGIIHYTIGQRRGLGIAYGRPLYVTKIDAQNNRIVVAGREDLSSKGFIASDLNLIAIERLASPLEASVKIRLNHAAVEAVIFPHAGEKARILFNKPQEAVCPGQHAVFYKEETVIGGGVIEETL